MERYEYFSRGESVNFLRLKITLLRNSFHPFNPHSVQYKYYYTVDCLMHEKKMNRNSSSYAVQSEEIIAHFNCTIDLLIVIYVLLIEIYFWRKEYNM